MGASAKHYPGQYTSEHGLNADAKQPLDTPGFFTEYDYAEHPSAASTIRSGHQSPGN